MAARVLFIISVVTATVLDPWVPLGLGVRLMV